MWWVVVLAIRLPTEAPAAKEMPLALVLCVAPTCNLAAGEFTPIPTLPVDLNVAIVVGTL